MPRTIGRRKDKRTKKQKMADFLRELAEVPSVTEACGRSNVPRTNVYEWKKEDPGFAAAFEEAADIATGKLEDEAARRAYHGVKKNIYQGGLKVGTERIYSDNLLMFLLKGRKPEKYKDRQHTELTGAGGKPIAYEETGIDYDKLSDAALLEIQAARKKEDD